MAHALGLENHAVNVECRRMGGGFGGKETQAGHMAVWAALAARKLRCPVKLRLDRDDDFMVTGKRHPFAYDYEVGVDDEGRILGLKLMPNFTGVRAMPRLRKRERPLKAAMSSRRAR